VADIPFYDCTPSANQSSLLMQAASRIIQSGNYVGGNEVESFEAELSEYLGGGFCVGVGNGLDALTLSLLALDVGHGDEVIVPTYSFMATWIAVSRTGAKLVGVDVDPSTGLVDLDQVRRAVTRRTKVFLPVHLYGAAVDIGEIRAELSGKGIAILEDTAQALGASSKDGMAGTLGTLGAFSFYPTKNLGALGDAGAIFTRDEGLYARLKSLRSYGFGSSRYEFREIGLNSRLDPIQAAFLRVKLPGLEAEGEHRRWQAGEYLKAIQGTQIKAVGGLSGRSVYHHFALLSDDRAALRRRLAEAGVMTDIHYPYTFEAFLKMTSNSRIRVNERNLKGARELARKVTTLPMGSWLNKEDSRTISRNLAVALRAKI